ncbi:hypothetical protein ES705_39590 [subsurface metagenome]
MIKKVYEADPGSLQSKLHGSFGKCQNYTVSVLNVVLRWLCWPLLQTLKKYIKSLTTSGRIGLHLLIIRATQKSLNHHFGLLKINSRRVRYARPYFQKCHGNFTFSLFLTECSITGSILEWVKESAVKRLVSIFRENFELRYANVIENAAPLGGAILVSHDIFREPSIAIK